MTYTWMFKGENETQASKVSDDPEYRIKATSEASGEYVCIVRSAFGEAKINVTVKVQEVEAPPTDPPKQAQIQDNALGIGLSVTALVIFVIIASLYIYHKKNKGIDTISDSFTDIGQVRLDMKKTAPKPLGHHTHPEFEVELSSHNYREYLRLLFVYLYPHKSLKNIQVAAAITRLTAH